MKFNQRGFFFAFAYLTGLGVVFSLITLGHYWDTLFITEIFGKVVSIIFNIGLTMLFFWLGKNTPDMSEFGAPLDNPDEVIKEFEKSSKRGKKRDEVIK